MNEGPHVEWKAAWRDEYLRWICGFANAHGGVLVLGRDDDGAPVGVPDAKKLLVDLPNKIRDVLGIVVDVQLVRRRKKDLIEVHVEPYPSPISYKGEYHYRSGSTKQELKGAALERFLLQKRGRHWDEVQEPSFTSRRTSGAAFRLFKLRAARSGRMDRDVLRDGQQQILANLELTSKHGLKRAACLLFAERPERYVSGAWVKVGYFDEAGELRYQDEVHGDLLRQVETTLDLLRTKYLKAAIRYDGLQRVETWPYADGALREALLNAVVHKDYASGIPIQIRVHEHQIVLWNPGSLPELWTLRRLLARHPSRPFNPLLANAFFRAGYIEAWGRGIERMHRECRTHGNAPPRYEFDVAGVMVTLRASSRHLAALRDAAADASASATTQNATQKTTQKTTGSTAEQLLALLRRNPFFTRADLAREIGITPDGVKYQLEKLKALGRLRRSGGRKSGEWEVLE